MEPLKYAIKKREALKFAGISVRINNGKSQAENDIQFLWERFFREKIFKMIPNKIDDNIYGIYSEYDSNHLGAYTAIVGCLVSQFEGLPGALTQVEVPEQAYAVFLAEGKLPEAVIDKWVEIWNSDFKRSYIADFDVYGKESQNPEDAKVEIWVGIKE